MLKTRDRGALVPPCKQLLPYYTLRLLQGGPNVSENGMHMLEIRFLIRRTFEGVLNEHKGHPNLLPFSVFQNLNLFCFVARENRENEHCMLTPGGRQGLETTAIGSGSFSKPGVGCVKY